MGTGFQNAFETLSRLIDAPRKASKPLVLALDGRCASGKTTLAERLGLRYGCDIVHMDHFFLQPFQRTPERLSEPGGNVDYQRFHEEVLAPLKNGTAIAYRIYDCSVQAFGPIRTVSPKQLLLVEGTYACRPDFLEFYDQTVFLTVRPEEQKRRLILREGPEGYLRFADRWIPLEESYFRRCETAQLCSYVFET